ncbi:MAG: hypothetical protein ACRDRK_07530 [Pseudonocardia sp.]
MGLGDPDPGLALHLVDLVGAASGSATVRATAAARSRIAPSWRCCASITCWVCAAMSPNWASNTPNDARPSVTGRTGTASSSSTTTAPVPPTLAASCRQLLLIGQVQTPLRGVDSGLVEQRGPAQVDDLRLDPEVVIENTLYWAAASGLDEARYLTAVLNSTALLDLVRPCSTRPVVITGRYRRRAARRSPRGTG